MIKSKPYPSSSGPSRGSCHVRSDGTRTTGDRTTRACPATIPAVCPGRASSPLPSLFSRLSSCSRSSLSSRAGFRSCPNYRFRLATIKSCPRSILSASIRPPSVPVPRPVLCQASGFLLRLSQAPSQDQTQLPSEVPCLDQPWHLSKAP